MNYPTESPKSSGSSASSSAALRKQDSYASLPGDSNDLMSLVNQAEASMHDHFQQIKNSLSALPGIPSSLPKVKDDERMILEAKLQSEREQMAQQRAQEQEQLRATMQQLADAWLKLEQEQRSLFESRTESAASSQQPPGGSTHSPLPGWSSRGFVLGENLDTTAEMHSMANADSLRRLNPITAMESSTNEELFHKLRSDLKRQIR